jgi:predicted amidohydrolase
VIRGARIAAIGPANEVAVPPGSRIVNGSGQFLIPGLIDMHTHVSKCRASVLDLLIAGGVTTVRDMGGDPEELFEWRSEVASGKRLGPRILMAGKPGVGNDRP